MPRRVKEYIEVEDYLSLHEMIDKLSQLESRRPADSLPELRLSGDDAHGRKLTISYFREMTEAEAELEASYAAATLQEMEARIDRLREQLEIINELQFGEPMHRAA